jgi:hypothetical protein
MTAPKVFVRLFQDLSIIQRERIGEKLVKAWERQARNEKWDQSNKTFYKQIDDKLDRL